MISNPEQPSFSFTCPPPEGAILVLPNGASRVDLVSRAPMEDYIKRNALRWYSTMVEREDLVIVTGADKCSSWGTACYSNVTGPAEMPLSFLPTDEGSPACEYDWETCHSIASHSGSSSEVGYPENQCIFIRGYKTKLRKRKLLPMRVSVSVSDVVQHNADIPGGAKGQGGNALASRFPGRLSGNRGGATQNLQSDTPNDTISVDDFPGPIEVSLILNGGRFESLFLVSPSIHWIASIPTYWTRFDHLQFFSKGITQFPAEP